MKVQNVLEGNIKNHIFPFMWVHGESEEIYRETIRAIYNANIRAFCVESRPHEDFLKEKWWRDMDVILDEAEHLGMKVWILDDKHFPTGYANGGVEHAENKLRRQSAVMKEIPVKRKKISWNLANKCHIPYSNLQLITDVYQGNLKKHNRFHDKRFISVTATRTDQKNERPVLLNEFVRNGKLEWEVPEGTWKIQICFLTRNAGTHRSYINMMDQESCKILIDQVYEPHYEHYKEKFGTVIAGFFSDEPELGNGPMYKMYNVLGTDQDLPWSSELEHVLKKKLGEEYQELLPLLWNNDCDETLTAKVRYLYMDSVTRLVEKDFSMQIGNWCRERGVEYIGHVIEDCNQHARTGTSLGHFFRGLKWQSMAGIDVIGGQIYPQGEDTAKPAIWNQKNDPEFYHYALAKLGSSLGDLNPNMKDRTMCEIFGNYGWTEGVKLEKYLLDHCMVRGVNYFVPHAFSCKAYPDKDCPPHFHAHGNDPLYRHFGILMQYTNRVTSLLEGKITETCAAVLYHAEAEWTGKCMMMQEPARILQEHQIDFHFIPCDVFEEEEFYKMEYGNTLKINGKEHEVLIIPYAQFIPEKTAEGIQKLLKYGFPVVFLDKLPDGTCQGGKLPEEIMHCDVVCRGGLLNYLQEKGFRKIRLNPESKRIRVMRCCAEEEVVYVFNEEAETYIGKIQTSWQGDIFLYDAWENSIRKVEETDGWVSIQLKPSQSCFLIKGKIEERYMKDSAGFTSWKETRSEILQKFAVSFCRSIEYPAFIPVEKLDTTGDFSKIKPKFSGFISYETTFELEGAERVKLTITEAEEAVEVFVNGKSAGIEILSPFEFDISKWCHPGKNDLRIEVATTLARENNLLKEAGPTGITGKVILQQYQQEK
ncbi:MAG: hypothetical protein ACI4S0_10675 [Dorea sp.]